MMGAVPHVGLAAVAERGGFPVIRTGADAEPEGSGFPRGLLRVGIAAVLSIAVISLASCDAAKTGGTPGGTSQPAPASQVVRQQAVQHTSSAACGASGGPALAYEAVSAAPGSTRSSVKVYCGSGATRTVATGASAVDGPLTWSANGSQLAWWDGSEVTVITFSKTRPTTRRWACTTCTGVGFIGERAVAVNMPSVGYPPRTQLLEYPRSGSGRPMARTVTGLSPVSAGEYTMAYGVYLLGSLLSGGIVVGLLSATQPYTPAELFYRIDSAGHATEYGTGTIGNTLRAIGHFASNAAGTEFAFAAVTGCRNYYHGDQAITIASLLDSKTGTVTTPATPAGGGKFGYWVEGMWFDPSGTPHVSLLKNLSDCVSSVPPWPPGAAPVDCTLESGRWVRTGSGVLQEEHGPGGWVADTTGAPPADGSAPALPLTISDGPAVRARARDVVTFTWAP
jgi:hypothetical protein